MATRKRILITAGPTWVALDKARVISNIASGQTGFILADKFQKQGIGVTLLLGPGYFFRRLKGLKIIRFEYFDQLKAILKKELEKKIYGAIIATAAVSDYRPDKIIKTKICADRRIWRINLVPTEKLIDTYKNHAGKLIRVCFKFEPDTTGSVRFIKEGRKLLKRAELDFVIANSNKDKKYCAYILASTGYDGPFLTKGRMAKRLVELVKEAIL